ncbi:MAG: MerR family transcriptional regulator [Clostridiales bacterium]|jgi:DNA-binding transcriptional MerR regulator|nr:MerR family transcriptional regulator [Clostridiales bacterium]
MGDEKLLTVGELAGKLGVTVRTLQYYDREGLLRPSETSEGGRRLYSQKDMVSLHQILALKHLGFSLSEIKSMRVSLSTPQEVAAALEKQHGLVTAQIEQLKNVLAAIGILRDEVLRINDVDFEKYADIIMLLQQGNGNYWIWKLLDDTLAGHIKDRFFKRPDVGMKLFNTYKTLVEQAVALKNKNEPPDSDSGFALAEKWWDMVMEFTGGDMSLVPNLMAFNDDKSNWDEDMAAKQKAIDDYIGQILTHYFERKALLIPGLGG